MNSPVPHQYDPANACFLVELAAASYQLHPELPNWNSFTIESGETDTRVLVACEAGDCVVAFRGTQDLRNWLTDLDCAFIRVGNLRVHRGFYEALASVRTELESVLAGMNFKRLWLTGHSLGGALAMLCARAWEGAVDGVYTFGQPRVGDSAFCARYDATLRHRTFRVLHADDIVPRVPWLLGAYRHAGHEIFYHSASSVGRDSVEPCNIQSGFDGVSPYRMDLVWPAKLMRNLPGLLAELRHGKLALLNDHHISSYQSLFKSLVNASQTFLTR